MGMFSRLQIMPSHFMLTFKEAFYTGFFEQQSLSRIFSPIITEYKARYVAFQAAADANPINLYQFKYE